VIGWRKLLLQTFRRGWVDGEYWQWKSRGVGYLSDVSAVDVKRKC